MSRNKETPIKLGTLAAVIGLAFLSMSLLFIQSSASYSASTHATADAATRTQTASHSASHSGRLTIPAAALPPFDPAATRITERDGTLIVQLAAGESRQDLHILPERTGSEIGRVQVVHVHHGQLMSLRIEDGCHGRAGANARLATPEHARSGERDTTPSKVACGRFAA
ncbi:MAG: hypothetical protein SF172_05790 [Burkholderiales bacterium]|nr:hypothetical protein [Burkholderiales bacterium]